MTVGVEITVDTPRGTAALRVAAPAGQPVALVALGHGAGGGVEAPDLTAVTASLLAAGAVVGLVTQPYRVAGRRAPAPAAALDEAWVAAVDVLRRRAGRAEVPLVTGGRSSGARVACRTAAATGSAGVVALAFPLVPPARRGARRPTVSRAGELEAALAIGPLLVVQGGSDPFGGPEEVVAAVGPAAGLAVHAVPGADHALLAGRPRRVPEEVPAAVTAAVRSWVAAAGIGPG